MSTSIPTSILNRFKTIQSTSRAPSNLLIPLIFVSVLTSCQSAAITKSTIKTAVITEKSAEAEKFKWGSALTFFAGESYGSKDSLTLVATIIPGMQIHPPHVHAEEEYLVVLEGEGTWTVKGKDFKASKGDILYAAPWDQHGIKNTGKTPLRFLVFKWNSKGISPMVKPK